MEKYNVVTACYGGRRGTTIAALAQARVDEMVPSGLEISVAGRGHKDFMGGKEDHPVSDEHIELLSQVAGGRGYVAKAAEALKRIGRKAATADDLESADAVYVVDNFVLDKYAELAVEDKGMKYRTVLDGAGMRHMVHGSDLDDTETSVDFTKRVIVPKKTGKGTPANLKPADAEYFSLDGSKYRAGDDKAKLQEARDLAYVAGVLAEKIVGDAQRRRVA